MALKGGASRTSHSCLYGSRPPLSLCASRLSTRPHISRCAEPTPSPSCSFIMNRQQYNQKYNSNLGKLGKSVTEGVMSATDNNIGEVFHHAGAITHGSENDE